LVECQLPKLNVAGSNPVSRSALNLRNSYDSRETVELVHADLIAAILAGAAAGFAVNRDPGVGRNGEGVSLG
jgi:hypothetical protein